MTSSSGIFLEPVGPTTPDPAVMHGAAVETRSQTRQSERGITPLKASTLGPGFEASLAEYKEAQRADTSLASLFESAKTGGVTEIRGGAPYCQLKNGLLYRIFSKAKTGRITSRLVVPSRFRQRVMSVAHEALMSGHLGVGKTIERVTSSFQRPGIMADIRRFFASCDICQRTAPKEHIRKAPLGTIPIDLIGPISQRRSRRTSTS